MEVTECVGTDIRTTKNLYRTRTITGTGTFGAGLTPTGTGTGSGTYEKVSVTGT